MRKLKLTKYVEDFYYIFFAVTRKQPPYTKREIEDKIVRMFKIINRMWCSIDKDTRRSFLNYYYILFKLLELMGQTELLPQVPLAAPSTRLHLEESVRWALLDVEANSHSLHEPIGEAKAGSL